MAQRRTWALPSSLLAGYGGLAAATAIAAVAGGARRPGLALAIVAAAALLLATRAKAAAAAAIGPMAWLFYAGFITGRHGDLSWHGLADLWRLAILAGSAAAGAGLSWLAARLAEGRVAEGCKDTSLGAENPWPDSPRAGLPWADGDATVIDLAEVRAGRGG
jgi:hypothetical protein